MTQGNRFSDLDALRGFALSGVLFSNFNAYTSQQVPTSILEANSSGLDVWLNNFNGVFFEWKFMSLFSILFGYGFGLIIENFKARFRHPEFLYLRRLALLFLFGLIHVSFWWFDVLHFYAAAGLLLLLFHAVSPRILLPLSLVLMLFVPHLIGLYLNQFPVAFTDGDTLSMYRQFKNGNLIELFRANWDGYYKLFVVSGYNYRDLPETIGRFLFGYWLMKKAWLSNPNRIKSTASPMFIMLVICAVAYFYLLINLKHNVHLLPKWIEGLFLRVGILCTTCVYGWLFLLFYRSYGNGWLGSAFVAMGKITLTLYLCVSAIMIGCLYGIGAGKLGEWSISELFLLACLTWIVFALFSRFWVKNFQYGPLEWIWRQFTYGKRLPIRMENRKSLVER
jgi:uncharacterized protein